MKNKEYARYGLKRFALYLIIGFVVSFMPLSFIGAFFAFPSILVASFAMSLIDVSRLKQINEYSQNDAKVFTKHSLIAIFFTTAFVIFYNILFLSGKINIGKSMINPFVVLYLITPVLIILISGVLYFLNKDKE